MDVFQQHFENLPNGTLNYDNMTGKYEHFGKGKAYHVNYLTFRELFRNMEDLKDPIILESGIASAGTNSTYLFNEYVRKYGGQFWSVDINKNLVETHQGNMCPSTKLVHDDSVSFFNEWVKTYPGKKADVIYLDSYDLDWYNPHPSAEHGLKEYQALLPAYQKYTLLLIDDTPVNPYWLPFRNDMYFYYDIIKYYSENKRMPGKGMYVLDQPKNANLLMHQYQVLYKFK
jgi:hypothetical protein